MHKGMLILGGCLTVAVSALGTSACSSPERCGANRDCGGLGQERAALVWPQGDQISLEEPFLDYQTNLYLSVVDNPVFGAVYEVGESTGTTMAANRQGYQIDHFELFFHETLVTPGPGTHARPEELRQWPSINLGDVSIGPEGDYFQPFRQHGARLGFGTLSVSATHVITPQNGPFETRDLTETTPYSLFPQTALVPVTAIVVVPAYSSVYQGSMQALAQKAYQELLWDDVWSVAINRFPQPGGGVSAVQGVAQQVADQVFVDDVEFKLWKAGNWIEPDSIWTQCGIQFRLVDIVVLDMPQEIPDPTSPGHMWRPVEFEKRQWCLLEGGGGCNFPDFNAGPCLDLDPAPDNITGTCASPVGVCDDSERERLARRLVELARAQPHNDIFGNPLPGMGPATMPIIFNATAKSDLHRPTGCLTSSAEHSDGFSISHEYSLITYNAPQYVPAHEIGHFLGLVDLYGGIGGDRCNDADESLPPGDRENLMCGFTSQMAPNIYSCSSWQDPYPEHPYYNCLIDSLDNPWIGATCADARGNALALQTRYLDWQACMAGEGTGPEFTVPPEPVEAHDCGPVDLGTVEAEDACDDEVDLDNDAPDSFGPGPTAVTWTATNDDGQQATATQEVSVIDTTPPSFEGPLPLPPIPLSNCGPATLPEPAANDACGEVEVTSNAPPSFGSGTTTITWTATDAAGVPATTTQDVVVTDTTGPEFRFVPGDVTTSNCTAPALGTPVATDACGSSVTISNNAPAKFPLGTTLVTWTARDAQMNTRTAVQRVTVVLGDSSSCCPSGTNVIVGTSMNDALNGTPGSDCILGRGAQDTINGQGGNDFISGGEGNDTIDSGSGNDSVFGGSGQDILTGGSGSDTLSGDGGDDFLYGGIGNDSLSGGQGQDQLNGEDGDDSLFGGVGFDTLNGGAGNDLLSGGAATDSCNDGTGTNRFELCEGGAPTACSDATQNGSETALDCGGGCLPCEEGLTCAAGGDCQSLVCSAGVCQDLPAGIAVQMVIDSDWGGGYCVHFDVTNVKAVATSNWSLTLGTGASTVTSASNATVTPSTGTVVLAPNANKRIISAGGTEGSTGFCANRAVSGSGVLPAIQGASGVY
jgi:hypothetical protein